MTLQAASVPLITSAAIGEERIAFKDAARLRSQRYSPACLDFTIEQSSADRFHHVGMQFRDTS